MPAETQVFLYKRGRVQYTGKLHFTSGKFKTTMVPQERAPVSKVTPRQAQMQRSSAMKTERGALARARRHARQRLDMQRNYAR